MSVSTRGTSSSAWAQNYQKALHLLTNKNSTTEQHIEVHHIQGVYTDVKRFPSSKQCLFLAGHAGESHLPRANKTEYDCELQLLIYQLMYSYMYACQFEPGSWYYLDSNIKCYSISVRPWEADHRTLAYRSGKHVKQTDIHVHHKWLVISITCYMILCFQMIDALLAIFCTEAAERVNWSQAIVQYSTTGVNCCLFAGTECSCPW